jgi:hypothetical protein
MRHLALLVVLSASSVPAHAGGTIEGYWQDTERRILFSADAPPGYVYGSWTALDPQQTYPTAKHIRRSGADYELTDLLYDDEEQIKVVRATDDRIGFARTNRLSHCSTSHDCALEDGDRLFCKLETRCPQAGIEQVIWRGEERYVRRASCERDGKRQQQGIPVRCKQ